MMSSKRESEQLMNELLPFAWRMLREFGEFHPFGGVIRSDGSLAHYGAATGEELGPGAEAADLLMRRFHTEAVQGRIRAAAIALNVTVELPTGGVRSDAVEIRIDHIDGYSADVFFPYRRSPGGELERGSTFAVRGDAFAFASAGDSRGG